MDVAVLADRQELYICSVHKLGLFGRPAGSDGRLGWMERERERLREREGWRERERERERDSQWNPCYQHNLMTRGRRMMICTCVSGKLLPELKKGKLTFENLSHTPTSTLLFIVLASAFSVKFLVVEFSTMGWETRVQSQVESYQRLKKWYLIPPCLILRIIRYVSRVKWSNPGKGISPSLTLWCSSYWKGSFRVALDYGC